MGQLPTENRLADPEAVAWNQNSPTIPLGKWWAREHTNSSILPNDLDWFKADSAQSYEEFANTSSTAQVNPHQFTVAIAKLAEQAGTRISLGTVEHINCSSDGDGASGGSAPLGACQDWSQKKVVSLTYADKATTEKHTLPATMVVLAAGPWTSTLLPHLRMSTLRAHSISIKVSKPLSAYCLFTEITTREASQPSKTIFPEIYARPNKEVYVCSQGDADVPLPSPTEIVAVSEQCCRDLVDAAASVSDELGAGQVIKRRACYLPVIDESLSKTPLIGYTGLEGLLLATGHSCWGISNAPATGKAISELIFDGEITCIQARDMDPRVIFSKNKDLKL